METIIKVELPLKRVPPPARDQFYACLPWKYRWFGWLFAWNTFGLGEFGGSRMNRRHSFELFRRVVLTVARNEYHDRSDKERADEYLRKWAEDEKELRGLRLLLMGDSQCAEVKQLIRDSFGVDLDEGTVK